MCLTTDVPITDIPVLSTVGHKQIGELCITTCLDVVALIKTQSRTLCANEATVLPHTVGLVCYGAVEAASSTSCAGACAALMAGDTYLVSSTLFLIYADS